jgi:TIR domain
MRRQNAKPSDSDLPWGPVKVIAGQHRGRIGYLDDTEQRSGCVYFGDPLVVDGWYLIQLRWLRQVTTSDLWERREALFRQVSLARVDVEIGGEIARAFVNRLIELKYVEDTLSSRMFDARLTGSSGKSVFISHSSKDKQFATWLSVDLSSRGHDPWLDEWKIRAGDSIMKSIAVGLDSCDVVVVVLSEYSVESKWVEREWHEKYWDEIASNEVMVIPILLRNCEIPRFLKTKKYADFREDYNLGLEEVLLALSGSKRP